MVCNQGRDGVRHEGKWEDSIVRWGLTSKRRVRFEILGMSESPILIPHKKHPGECAWSEYCNNSEKSKRVYFLSKQQIYSM